MCAQQAWQQANDENLRQVLEYGAETIRALMTRCVALARYHEQNEPDDKPPVGPVGSVSWEFDIAEGDVMAGPDSALAEINRDETFEPSVADFRTLTIPCAIWFGNDRDAVEVRAFAGWLTQMADWLEGTR